MPEFLSHGVPITILKNRSFDDYKRELQIPEGEVFRDSIAILDLGSGERQQFARDLYSNTSFSRKSLIVSLDPRMGLSVEQDVKDRCNEEIRREGRINPVKNTLAGVSFNLPFKNESFDYIYALWSIPRYFDPLDEEYAASFREVYRVLKPGGEFRAFPFSNFVDMFRYDIIKAAVPGVKIKLIPRRSQNLIVLAKGR
jgi:SAM-dependent methyltransferase